MVRVSGVVTSLFGLALSLTATTAQAGAAKECLETTNSCAGNPDMELELETMATSLLQRRISGVEELVGSPVRFEACTDYFNISLSIDGKVTRCSKKDIRYSGSTSINPNCHTCELCLPADVYRPTEIRLMRMNGEEMLDSRPVVVVMRKVPRTREDASDALSFSYAWYSSPNVSYGPATPSHTSAGRAGAVFTPPQLPVYTDREAGEAEGAEFHEFSETGVQKTDLQIETRGAISEGECLEHQTEDMGKVAIFHRVCVQKGTCAAAADETD